MKLKNFTLAICMGLVMSVLMSFAGFDASCLELKDNLLRLHIVANSNNENDQALKLKVRDKIIERMSTYNAKSKDKPDIYYVGNSISSSYLADIMDICEGKDVSINMISKSGTTTETSIAFRIFKDLLETTKGNLSLTVKNCMAEDWEVVE